TTIGALFFNETESPITSITVAFTMEQWRFGGNTSTRPAGMKDIIPFSYSLDATSIANTAAGTFVPVPQLNLESVITTGTAGARDGNSAGARQLVTYTITGLNIAPGGSFLMRWTDSDTPGSDDGLSIDDFTIAAGLAPGELSSGGTRVGGGTGSGGGATFTIPLSTPVFEHKAAKDSSFLHLYGNLHGHSTHSDGRPSTLQPKDDYEYARNAAGMDFLGISEHNHATAGLQIADYKLGYLQAEAANGQLNAAGNAFLALHGMEWGTISGGGHVLVYGFKDSLINWEAGNNDIFVPKSDYKTLFEKVQKQPGAFATLAHPNSGDFTGLTTGYKGIADSAVSSIAIESGPAFSTATNYTDFPSSLSYINYYKTLLKQGYRIAAHMDQDNHEMTFGTANANRMVVLAKERTREALVSGIQSMRVYATNDYNASISFTMDDFIMGSSIKASQNITGSVVHADADGEALSAVQVYGGKVGGEDALLVHSAIGNTTFGTAQANGETWYYFAIITQQDGNKIITAPIWVTTEIPLPKNDLKLKAKERSGAVELTWKIDEDVLFSHYVVEVSTDGRNFTAKGSDTAVLGQRDYSFIDMLPYNGVSFYRITLLGVKGNPEYSQTVSIELKKPGVLTVYPNPASASVNVRFDGADSETILVQLIDAAGNMVYNKVQAPVRTFSLNLSHFANGYYILRVNDQITRLIISK
ncbi:MAG TPA: CehA/McbA family metallohydrolase, partial [Flavisolibacter sp.]